MAQLKAVHERHLNICNDDVGSFLLDHGIGDFTVARFAAEIVAVRTPVDIVLNTFADDELILDQKYFQHRTSPSPQRNNKKIADGFGDFIIMHLALFVKRGYSMTSSLISTFFTFLAEM